MLGVLGRRGVEGAISLFAVLGFCYVPLGQHTGLEHAKAIFSTAPAKRAAAELIEAVARVRRTVTDEVEELGRTHLGAPTAPSGDAIDPRLHAQLQLRHGSVPKPNPPRLASP